MRLFIAEKPSAAKALAGHLGSGGRVDGAYVCGPDHVTWCVGHLFEQAAPEDYSPTWKAWSLDTLPIVPDEWRKVAKKTTQRQLQAIGRLLRQARTVVHFGDPDNEGQLLVDEVLEHFGCRLPVQRLWISALDPPSIEAGLRSLQPNARFTGMRDAARARGRADWLVGMNFSRAFTLQAQAAGGTRTLSVGRVQTPTLALVHNRCEQVRAFRPHPFHDVIARVRVAGGEFDTTWRPPEGASGLDAEGRLVDRVLADALVARCAGAAGRIDRCKTVRRTSHQPASLSLASLTILASRVFGYKAAQVLAVCQALYETHRLVSYPRTDCEYLPESQHAEAPDVLAALAHNIPGVAEALAYADASIRSRTWNDAKVTAHHGIIPRPTRSMLASLSLVEANVYQLIARAYLAQFFPLHVYEETEVVATFAGEPFGAKGRKVLQVGWKALYEDDDEDLPALLPAMNVGDSATAVAVRRVDRKTTAPKLFTEGELVRAMENIHTALEGAERAALKEAEGIGTPATRANIIEELKRRRLLAEQGRYLVSTDLGAGLLAALPEQLASPHLAARWEQQLRSIERGQLALHEFVLQQADFVAQRVAKVKRALPSAPTHVCPCGGTLRRREYRRRYFWGCNRYPDCTLSFPDASGSPLFNPPQGDLR